MKKSKNRIDIPIRADLHKEISHISIDRNSTIQLITDELIELGLKQTKKEKQNESENESTRTKN